MSNSVLELWDRCLNVIISFFSGFILDLITDLGNRIELILIVLIVFAIWMMFDNFTRKFLIKLETIKENVRWKEVILGILDFVSMVLIYLVVQIFLRNLNVLIQMNNLNLFEIFVIILAVLMIGFSIYQTIKQLAYLKIDTNNL